MKKWNFNLHEAEYSCMFGLYSGLALSVPVVRAGASFQTAVSWMDTS